MSRYLVIAARSHSDLYGHLQRQFPDDRDVQILLDRRGEERRRQSGPCDPERRRGERRGGRGKDHGLQQHGFLVVRQGRGPGIQWLPPSWQVHRQPEAGGFESPQRPGEVYATETRMRVTTWITQGQRLLSLVSKLLVEYGQLTTRAEAAERKCERLEAELKLLRGETDHLRRERRQLAESLRALARQLMESAGETA